MTESIGHVAHVAIQDRTAHRNVVSVLEGAGWTVISQPSGFHLIRAIADIIDGARPWLRPGLIVVDAHARGCAGTTIAAGLRELGIAIPIVVLAPGESLPDKLVQLVQPLGSGHHHPGDPLRAGRAEL
jgi:hypothetical protein